ncbi:MAG: Ig-like domain-containing protein [Clostridia bacterium]|nr:Ig-like domain-containing protein [Clostridia bacterium]
MKKMILRKLCTAVCALLTFVLVFSFAACNPESTDDSITLNTNFLTIDVGSTSPLLVTSTVTEDVVWTSSDESKVTVEGSGSGKRMCMVSAVANGTATVTATSGDKFATCSVTVVDAETVTITQNGSAASSVSLSGKGATAQLTAKSSRDHDITWETNKPMIVSVSDNGLVTAVAESGTAVLTARCGQHTDVSQNVTVVVGTGVDAAYNLEQGDENNSFGNKNSNDNPGLWMYWNQFGNVASATYENGVVSLTTSGVEEGAWWYNVQLFYTATAEDKDTKGNALKSGTMYQVTFDIDTTMGGGITVNGYPLQLKEGVNHCTAYYMHSVTAFSMQLGIDGVGCDLTNATLKLSNIKWTPAEKVNLTAPSFSITNNVITINDNNPAGSVGRYILVLYNDAGTSVGSVKVTNGATVDTSKIRPNGTYIGKLIAKAANEQFINAPEATSQNASVVVNNEHVAYTIGNGGEATALDEMGTWTYWTESWVAFNGTVTDEKANITFSNNTGNWYDTQLFYKMPGKNVGDSYSVKLHFNNIPKEGRVSVNDVVYTLKQGDNVIDLNITESGGKSIQVIFGVVNESNRQDFGTLTNLELYIELV